jgi:hypothetical protein
LYRFIQRRLIRVFSGTSFCRSVYTWSVPPGSFMTLRFAVQDVNRVLKPGGVLEVCRYGSPQYTMTQLWPVR